MLPLRLLQLQVAVVYLFSTLCKFNDGWWTGHLLRAGNDKLTENLIAHDVGWLAPLLTWTPWYALAAWLTVLFEGFLVVGFLVPRWRPWALFIGVVLHAWIDVALDVGAYSLVMFAAYIAFIEPVAHQHTLRVLRGHRLRRLGALDWLGRLHVGEHDGPLQIVDVDGSVVAEDRAALLFALRRLPLTFVPAFAVDVVASWRRRRRERRAVRLA